MQRLPSGVDRKRRGRQPLFFFVTRPVVIMIQISTIREMAEGFLAEHNGFVVDCSVSEGSDIRLWVDADQGMPISKCAELSRFIGGQIDDDRYDFSIQVSTPGLDQGLKVHRQYKKNVGRNVAVQLMDGHNVEGALELVEEESITVGTRKKERIEGRKAKQWVEEKHCIKFADIASTKVKISFK